MRVTDIDIAAAHRRWRAYGAFGMVLAYSRFNAETRNRLARQRGYQEWRAVEFVATQVERPGAGAEE